MCIFFLAVLKINTNKNVSKCHLLHFYHSLEGDEVIVICFLSLCLANIYYIYMYVFVEDQRYKILKSYTLLSWVNALGLTGTFPESVFKSGEKSWVAFRSFFLMLSFSATNQPSSLPPLFPFFSFRITSHCHSTITPFPSFPLPPEPKGWQ